MTEANTTFYWYDYETFGLSPSKDRPCQFAGIRTDEDLNPIGEADLFYNRISEDYLPDPKSVMITGILPQKCEEEGIPEREFASKIFSRLNQPGTISLGYNTIKFDDEVNRFLFWRNFCDPYSHMFADGCSRWDIYPLVLAVWALRRENLSWPLNSEVPQKMRSQDADPSRVCFKLEALAAKNGIKHEHAHDALSDVEATIGLARLIKKNAPKLWQWALANKSKQKVKDALSSPRVVWVSQYIGQEKGFTMVGAPLFIEGNDAYVWDLREDPEVLRRLSFDEVKQRMKPKSEIPEGIEKLPVYRLKINSSPFVCADARVLSAKRAAEFGIDMALTEKRAQELESYKDSLQGMFMSILEEEKAQFEAQDADSALYEGFVPPADKRAFSMIRDLSGDELAEMADAGRLNFEDERLNEMLFRFRCRNHPETLSQKDLVRWNEFCWQRLMQGRFGARSLGEFVDAVDELAQSGMYDDEASLEAFDSLYAWAERYYEKFSDQ